MFSVSDIKILNESLDSHEAVLKRRFNAEKNDSIKEIISSQIVSLQATRVAVNNPKVVAK